MTRFELDLNRGSNLDVVGTLRENGIAIDMTSWAVEWIDIQPATLLPDLVIAISNPAAGQLTIQLPWSDTLWPKGHNAQVLIRWRLSGLPEAFPELVVVLK